MAEYPKPRLPNDQQMPHHVGIIMDGNGRWARQKNKPRAFGHRQGLTAAKRVVKAAATFGLRYLTLYTFSTENWRRAEKEVNFLLRLISRHLRGEGQFYRENRIRVLHAGDISALPEYTQKEIVYVCRQTATFDGLTVILAINYGGQDEIVRSVNRFLANHGGSEKITASLLEASLDVPEIPAVDLVIRSGGETRLSNFLTWQAAYAELYFCQKLWPDWKADDLMAALLEFSRRQRRFGREKSEKSS